MPATRITSKGQVTIPKAIRDALCVGPDDRVLFVRHDDGTVVVQPETVDVRSLKGRLNRYVTRPVSVDEMSAAIAEATVRSYPK